MNGEASKIFWCKEEAEQDLPSLECVSELVDVCHAANRKEKNHPPLHCQHHTSYVFPQAMMDPDPVKRPSAKEILEHSIFEKPKGVSFASSCRFTKF